MWKRWLYRMFQEAKVTQSQKDEDEFLSDLDILRSKWTMRNKGQYVGAVKAIISEFTNPDHVDEEIDVEYIPVKRMAKTGDPNIVS